MFLFLFCRKIALYKLKIILFVLMKATWSLILQQLSIYNLVAKTRAYCDDASITPRVFGATSPNLEYIISSVSISEDIDTIIATGTTQALHHLTGVTQVAEKPLKNYWDVTQGHYTSYSEFQAKQATQEDTQVVLHLIPQSSYSFDKLFAYFGVTTKRLATTASSTILDVSDSPATFATKMKAKYPDLNYEIGKAAVLYNTMCSQRGTVLENCWIHETLIQTLCDKPCVDYYKVTPLRFYKLHINDVVKQISAMHAVYKASYGGALLFMGVDTLHLVMPVTTWSGQQNYHVHPVKSGQQKDIYIPKDDASTDAWMLYNKEIESKTYYFAYQTRVSIGAEGAIQVELKSIFTYADSTLGDGDPQMLMSYIGPSNDKIFMLSNKQPEKASRILLINTAEQDPDNADHYNSYSIIANEGESPEAFNGLFFRCSKGYQCLLLAYHPATKTSLFMKLRYDLEFQYWYFDNLLRTSTITISDSMFGYKPPFVAASFFPVDESDNGVLFVMYGQQFGGLDQEYQFGSEANTQHYSVLYQPQPFQYYSTKPYQCSSSMLGFDDFFLDYEVMQQSFVIISQTQQTDTFFDTEQIGQAMTLDSETIKVYPEEVCLGKDASTDSSCDLDFKIVKADYKYPDSILLRDPYFDCSITGGFTFTDVVVEIVPTGKTDQIIKGPTIFADAQMTNNDLNVYCTEKIYKVNFKFFFNGEEFDPSISTDCSSSNMDTCDEAIFPLAKWVKDTQGQLNDNLGTVEATIAGVTDAINIPTDIAIQARAYFQTEWKEYETPLFEIKTFLRLGCVFTADQALDEYLFKVVPKVSPESLVTETSTFQIGGYNLADDMDNTLFCADTVTKTEIKFWRGETQILTDLTDDTPIPSNSVNYEASILANWIKQKAQSSTFLTDGKIEIPDMTDEFSVPNKERAQIKVSIAYTSSSGETVETARFGLTALYQTDQIVPYFAKIPDTEYTVSTEQRSIDVDIGKIVFEDIITVSTFLYINETRVERGEGSKLSYDIQQYQTKMFQLESNLLRIYAPISLFTENNIYSKDIFQAKTFLKSNDPEYIYNEWQLFYRARIEMANNADYQDLSTSYSMNITLTYQNKTSVEPSSYVQIIIARLTNNTSPDATSTTQTEFSISNGTITEVDRDKNGDKNATLVSDESSEITNAAQTVKDTLDAANQSNSTSAEALDKQRSAVTQQVDNLLNKTDNNIQSAIEIILDVTDGEKVISDSQSQVKLADDQDFDEVAQFDIQEWFAQKGYSQDKSKTQGYSELPKELIEQEVRKQFAVPVVKNIGKSGKLVFQFSHMIKKPIFADILVALKSLDVTPVRRLDESESDTQESQANESGEIKELQKIETLLKLTNCIKMEFLPGNERNLDKKEFKWNFKTFDENQIDFALIFENPKFISMETPDRMRVSFKNTKAYLISSVEGIETAPDGFELIFAIPPQSESLLSQDFDSGITTSTQTFVVTNLVLKFVLKESMSVLFGSIMSLQILAHLPLANINLPANAMQSFDIMVQVASFDYFPLHEYFDFGFTETEPWSEKFAYLDYDSINFIEGLGSVALFYWMMALYVLIVVMFYKVIRRLKGRKIKWIKQVFSPMACWLTLIGFLNGTFFEVSVSLSVSMKMLELWDYLNDADKFSVANQCIFGVIFFAFVVFSVYFGMIVTRKLKFMYLHKRVEKNKEVIQTVHYNFKQTQIKKSKARNELDNSKRMSSEMVNLEANALIDVSMKRLDSVKEKVAKINKTELKIYKPLHEGLRKSSTLCLMFNLFLMIRRISLLYAAMFLSDLPWLQMMLFMSLSAMSLFYMQHEFPKYHRNENLLDMFNEAINLVISYNIMAFNGLCNESDQYEQLGNIITRTLYFCWAVNFLVALVTFVKEIRQKILRRKAKKAWNKKKAKVMSQVKNKFKGLKFGLDTGNKSPIKALGSNKKTKKETLKLLFAQPKGLESISEIQESEDEDQQPSVQHENIKLIAPFSSPKKTQLSKMEERERAYFAHQVPVAVIYHDTPNDEDIPKTIQLEPSQATLEASQKTLKRIHQQAKPLMDRLDSLESNTADQQPEPDVEQIYAAFTFLAQANKPQKEEIHQAQDAKKDEEKKSNMFLISEIDEQEIGFNDRFKSAIVNLEENSNSYSLSDVFESANKVDRDSK